MNGNPHERRAARRRAGLLFLGLFAALGSVRAQTVESRDTVVLTDGKEMRGRIIRVDDEEIVLRVGSRDRTIERARVESFDSVAEKQRKLLSTWRGTKATDVMALLALALHADDIGLPHEARLMRWYAALQRPADATIHEALGNRKRRNGYAVQIDGRWVPFEKADALGEDFDDAWELRSEHFQIRCAAGLKVALDTLMELEFAYWTMHDLFGSDLELQELVEPIGVRVYRSREQMPKISNTSGAYFSVSERELFTCYENGRPYALIHEGTHGLLHFFFVRAAGSRGTIPAWLDEGWAEYMSGRIQTRVPGKPTLLAASMQPGHFATLAQAQRSKDLYGVHRVLNFKTSDFFASSKQSVKYAQAWALFRYLRENPDPGLRDRFTQYLRDAAAGKGQASTFRKLFRRDQKQIDDEAWRQ